MPTKTDETWLCPLCSLEKMKYGTTCKEAHEGTCKHLGELNVNGRFLLGKEHSQNKGIGISEISDM